MSPISSLAPALTELLTLTYGPATLLPRLLRAVRGIERAYLVGPWAARRGGEPGAFPHRIDVVLVGEIRDRLSPYRQFHPAETDRLAISHDGHKDIVDAIVQGNGEAAYLAMRAHNAHLGNAALRALRQSKEAEDAMQPEVAAPVRKRATATTTASKTVKTPKAAKPVKAEKVEKAEKAATPRARRAA